MVISEPRPRELILSKPLAVGKAGPPGKQSPGPLSLSSLLCRVPGWGLSPLELSSSNEISNLIWSDGRSNHQCLLLTQLSLPFTASLFSPHLEMPSVSSPPGGWGGLLREPWPSLSSASWPRPVAPSSQTRQPSRLPRVGGMRKPWNQACGQSAAQAAAWHRPAGPVRPLSRESGCGNKRIKPLAPGPKARRFHEVRWGHDRSRPAEVARTMQEVRGRRAF